MCFLSYLNNATTFMRNMFDLKKVTERKGSHILTRVISTYIGTKFYEGEDFRARLVFCSVPHVIEANRSLADCQRPSWYQDLKVTLSL